MSTLDGWDNDDQEKSEVAFSTWITSNNLTVRDEAIDKRVKKAARATISGRTKATSAYSFKNLLKTLTGASTIEADQVSKD
jgi:hypothetical protein